MFAVNLLENRFPAVHGLRVLGILLVVACHSVPTGDSSSLFTSFRSRLWIGMDLFFLLSGFLIGTILLHLLETKGISSFPRFYVRRLFRTLPLYYVCLAVLAYKFGLSPTQQDNLYKEILLVTNYPYRTDYVMPWSWSLSLEEHFYLVSPLLFWVMLRIPERYRLPSLAVLFFVPLILRLATDVTSAADFVSRVYTPTHVRFDPLIAGAFLAYAVRTNGVALQAFYSHTGRSSMALVGGCLILALAAALYPHGFATNFKAASFSVGTLTSLGYLPVVLWAIYGGGSFHSLLGSFALRVTATLGYGLYLVHVPVLHLIGSRAPVAVTSHFVPLVLSTMVVSLLIAYVLHIIVEKPSLWLRARLTER
jgi:peptidoglycan/LPS O-acetylase OafA/YrhL